MTTDPVLKSAQEREHELAIQLGQSLVRIDALKFELSEATARIATLEAERDGWPFVSALKRIAVLERERDRLRKALEDASHRIKSALPNAGAWDSQCPFCGVTCPAGELRHAVGCVVTSVSAALAVGKEEQP